MRLSLLRVTVQCPACRQLHKADITRREVRAARRTFGFPQLHHPQCLAQAQAPAIETPVECPKCKARAGEKCRNYLGRNCAPHRERIHRNDPPKPKKPNNRRRFKKTVSCTCPRCGMFYTCTLYDNVQSARWEKCRKCNIPLPWPDRKGVSA